ncbi:uncharacterized protein LOC135216882 [Macrobrachium nipponense]|uniref:uncharacterized protein LOC135216882 n=1 Tax=Macrobrachium nipponense TaxID=159736 RepID=UPI0030C86328
MLKWFVVPLLLATVCCIRPSAKADSEATGLDPIISKESPTHQRQQVSSWSSPFSQWRWFNQVLSLHENQIDEVGHMEAKSPSTAANGGTEDDDSMLSLVVLLNDSQEEEEVEEEAFRAKSDGLKDTSTRAPPPFTKRSKPCTNQNQSRCRRGQVSMIPANQVKQGWEEDYTSVPDVLIQFSQKQAEETVCNDLSVQLFRVDLSEHYLEPVWVKEIVHLGMCPSKLQTRSFGKDVWPSTVVETKCLCNNQPCSNLGGDFRCQAVRKPIRTWVRHVEKFMPVQEMITVGCVCVQRTSPEGKYARPAIEA